MSLLANKQKMWYSNQLPERYIYQTDKDGNIVYIEVDGVLEPVVESIVRDEYQEPIEFWENISTSGSPSEVVDFGIDTSSYQAKIVAPKGLYPFDETTLIWHESEPQVDKLGKVKRNSADYRVIRILPSLRTVAYLLEKVVK